jgi:DnaJ-class molecular chaperone
LENLYNILVVSPTATPEEIKKAYRSLAMRHHPDRSTHPDAEIRFNKIKTAYELLLWHSWFDRCGVVVPHDDNLSY